MVSSYLVHHGFSSTAEAFAKSTGQTFNEDLASIKTRQSKCRPFQQSLPRYIKSRFSSLEILKLVLSGRMGQAIDQTIRFYPGLLESNQNLLFMLKCRQFVEMVNGCDFDVSVDAFRTNGLIFTPFFSFFTHTERFTGTIITR